MAAGVAQSRSDIAARRLAELDQRCRRGLYLVALRALGDEEDAREVVQETLARAIEAITANRIPPQVPLANFVQGIARHVIADAIRSRVRHPATSLDDETPIPAPARSPLDAIVDDEQRRQVAVVLAGLSRDDREFLHRCYVTGEPLVDIAAALGVTGEQVRKRKSRLLDRLRAHLREGRHDSSRPTTRET